MRVLLLSYEDSRVKQFLDRRPLELIQTMDKLTLGEIQELEPDLIVSYGYRHIIKGDVIDAFEGRIVNLHMSYLPWNRGADPNAWSIIDETPKGVTVHLIDRGVDTGDIIFQRRVAIADEDTLARSYENLRDAMETLFIENWQSIRDLSFEARPQEKDAGSFHLVREGKQYFERLGLDGNWQMTAGELKRRRDADKQIVDD
jgi:methionyl-tRNA formyltransferase